MAFLSTAIRLACHLIIIARLKARTLMRPFFNPLLLNTVPSRILTFISWDHPYLTPLFIHFQEYITYYIFWSKFLLVEMIPYITIIVLNSMILGKIWKSTQFRKRFVVSEGRKCRDIRTMIPEHHTHGSLNIVGSL